MKVKLSRTLLTQLFGKIQSIVPMRSALPILMNILIEAKEGKCTISATDLTVSMKVFGEAEVIEEGTITLPARRLFQLVRELTTPDVEIHSLSPEVAVISSGSSQFRLQGISPKEFPIFPDLSEGVRLEFKGQELKEMLIRTAFAAARDESRQTLSGVFMEKIAKLATFTGTDGKRLSRNQIDLQECDQQPLSCIFPLKAVEEMIKLLDDTLTTLTLMKDKLAIEIGSVILITKLLAGQYPDVTRVIPSKTEQAIALHREELMTLLRQVALFTSETNTSVRFAFSQGALHLSATNGEIGEGKVSMPVNYKGTELDIAFNPHSFLDILRHSKDEVVYFDITDSYNPGLITDSSKAEFVIMPMRLEK